MEDAHTCATSLSVKDGASSMSAALVTASAVRARLRGAAVRRGAAIASRKPSWPRGGPRQQCLKRPVIVTVYAPIDVIACGCDSLHCEKFARFAQPSQGFSQASRLPSIPGSRTSWVGLGSVMGTAGKPAGKCWEVLGSAGKCW